MKDEEKSRNTYAHRVFIFVYFTTPFFHILIRMFICFAQAKRIFIYFPIYKSFAFTCFDVYLGFFSIFLSRYCTSIVRFEVGVQYPLDANGFRALQIRYIFFSIQTHFDDGDGQWSALDLNVMQRLIWSNAARFN